MTTFPDIITPDTELGDRAAFFMRAATAAVRRWCGWHVCPSMEVSGFVSTTGGTILRLPVRNLTSVKSIVGSDGDEIGRLLFTPDGIVELDRFVPPSIAGISYEVTAGYDPEDCPDVVAVIMQVARRAQSAPAGVVRSQSVNGASVTYGIGDGGAASVSLLSAERDRLAPYKVLRIP